MTDDRGPDDLYEQLVLAVERGEIGAVSQLVAAHPEYEQELTAFAIMDALLAAPADHDELASAAKLVTPDLRARALAAASGGADVALAGLFLHAAVHGMDARGFAAAVDLPRDILVKLDRRLIVATSIPTRCVQRLAEALQVHIDSVRAYLAGPSRVAAFNYAPGPPEVAAQDLFSAALASSSLATPAQRATWQQALRDEDLA